jgi:4-hydroxybenzoate polyprenyltransferase
VPARSPALTLSAFPAAAELGLSLKALRTGQWWYFVPVVAASARTPAGFGRGALCAAACLAFAYGLNAWTDRHADASANKNPLVGANVPRALMALLMLCAAAAVALGGVAAAASIAAGFLYSAGPRLKAMPLVCTAANAAIFVPLLFVGREAEPPVALLAAFLALLTQNQLVHELADLSEDARAGVRTTAGLLGARASLVLAAAVGALGAAALVATPAAAAVVGVGGAAAALLGAKSPRLARVGHRFYALAGGALLYALEWGLLK